MAARLGELQAQQNMDAATVHSMRALRHNAQVLLSVTRARARGAWSRRWLACTSSTRRLLVVCSATASVATCGLVSRAAGFVILHALAFSACGNLLWWLLDTRQQLRLVEQRHAPWDSR